MIRRQRLHQPRRSRPTPAPPRRPRPAPPPRARRRVKPQPRPLPPPYVAIPNDVPPEPDPLVSQIDPAFPVFGAPTTASVRSNFAAAKSEIEALQDEKLDLAGGTMTGPIVFVDGQDIDGGEFS